MKQDTHKTPERQETIEQREMKERREIMERQKKIGQEEAIGRQDCPCPRKKCENHGDCKTCRQHHLGGRYAPYCERAKKKKEKS